MDVIDTLVVGAGVIGLACADAAARAGLEVVVVESEARYGSGISSRNSEVVHSGLYYPPDSMKARLCVQGRRMLYEFCARHGVPHRRCGKLVVATQDAQCAELERLQARGVANGVDGLRLIDRAEARRLEPELECVAALLSESTGIVDSHGLMTALLGRAQTRGASLVLQTRFDSATALGDAGFDIRLTDANGLMRFRARRLVIAAGLYAPSVAARIEGLPAQCLPVERYAKGNYCALIGRAPFSRLIYPVPEKDGLGVHLTLDLSGQARFGPDVQWIDAPDYTVNAERLPDFYRAIRTYWRGLADGQLRPDYAGVRPKIYTPDQPAADFNIAGPDAHGVDGLVCLFGIESPGLTGALAIGEVVAGQLGLPMTAP
jgi:L-2-hydroxyglutarate oxidase LhgO